MKLTGKRIKTLAGIILGIILCPISLSQSIFDFLIYTLFV